MSENKDDSTEISENESNVIYIQYDGNLASSNEDIVLEIIDEPHSEEKDLKVEKSSENSEEATEEIDSPDLVNIEDYKSQGSFANNSEKDDVQSTAVLCETSLEADKSDDTEDVKFYNILNENLIGDIPNEVLVYTCQPKDQKPLNIYPCKGCGMIVGCVFCLKSHYESIHLNLGIIQYKCDQTSYLRNYTEICNKCNLVCESKDEMIEHRKIHFVTCDVCDMSFDSALFLSNHCKTAHEKFEVIISCDLCEQWFKQLQDLSEHYESFHEMILCIVCFKRFSTHSEMEEHHNSHTIVLKHVQTILPYACSKCNQAFSEINELSSHLTKEHPKKKTYFEKIAPEVNNVSKKKGKGKRQVIFDDCGGLSQEFIIVDKRTKKLKTDDQ